MSSIQDIKSMFDELNKTGNSQILRSHLPYLPDGEERVELLNKIHDEDGNPIISIAIESNHLEFITFIRDHLNGEQWFDLLQVKSKQGLTAVHIASSDCDNEQIKCLLSTLNTEQRSKLLQIKDDYGNTSLYHAQLKPLKWIRDNIAYQVWLELLKIQNLRGSTVLHYAASSRNIKVVKCILFTIGETQELWDLLNVTAANGYTSEIDKANASIIQLLEVDRPEKADELRTMMDDSPKGLDIAVRGSQALEEIQRLTDSFVKLEAQYAKSQKQVEELKEQVANQQLIDEEFRRKLDELSQRSHNVDMPQKMEEELANCQQQIHSQLEDFRLLIQTSQSKAGLETMVLGIVSLLQEDIFKVQKDMAVEALKEQVANQQQTNEEFRRKLDELSQRSHHEDMPMQMEELANCQQQIHSLLEGARLLIQTSQSNAGLETMLLGIVSLLQEDIFKVQKDMADMKEDRNSSPSVQATS